MMKRTAGEKAFAVFNTLFLITLCILFLVPVWHVAMGSISDPLKTASSSGLILQPLGTPTLGGYRLIFQNSVILRAYANTLFYVTVATLIGVILTVFAAYVMSTKGLLFGRAFSLFILFTMIFSGGLVPSLMVITKLGLYNTVWAVILPGAVTAFNIIILRTWFRQLPQDMLDAARIDGAGDFRILLQIVLPLSKPALAVIVLFYAVQHWNAWFHASVYLLNRDLYPLQLVLRQIVLEAEEVTVTAGADAAGVMIYRPLIRYASIMVSVIPMMAIYPFIQKYFVSGILAGSLKE
ncbi:MAG: carbohydrate ABC transporter permease [Solobacterium sp.]|nr:carbohydrate ABC transporter permease [Solobacterium sp.]